MMMMMMTTTTTPIIITTTTTVRGRLDDCAIEVRTPVGTKDFSSIRCVHTGSGAHPVSCPMGTGACR
jgi:hypothetical protein